MSVATKSKTTHAEKARRYLQADMNANYSGMPAEHREAYEGTKAHLRRSYPEVHTHALVGSDSDFDQPLSAGEREHQAHMRRSEGMSHGQVLEARKQLRSPSQSKPKTKPTRPPARRSTGRSRSSSSSPTLPNVVVQSGIPGAAKSMGSNVLEIIGVGIGLSLAYLLLSKKGTSAFTGILSAITGFVTDFIDAKDPLGGSTTSASSSTPGPGPEPSASVKANQRKTLEKFGGPSVGGIVTPIGGTK